MFIVLEYNLTGCNVNVKFVKLFDRYKILTSSDFHL